MKLCKYLFGGLLFFTTIGLQAQVTIGSGITHYTCHWRCAALY
ncbi:hypothetical protein M2451_003682 [Dysgonomonas sp. PFB1-18]|nr:MULTISPECIES: hypothetical protein [unclassified Dysgonomonas]MDH6310871.1 hypothetical protein [Dysgonomonas sp. PF1-14]MDH6340691.1 hypothetical protein [Dysgonomonas sp. PF1-16]MDH6382341.1 hypothetical protein [Dysgonomonas sp. PFB1-18]MDH6399691.1 hypothetical protein [Dysgonomonas sp. PF1-23]